MKTTLLNILWIFLLPLWSFAHLPEGKYKKTKTVYRTYKLEAQNDIFINNSYGNIQILTWNKKTVDIKAIISVDGNNYNNVTNRLNSIEIEISKNNRSIRAITQIGNIHSSWNLMSWIFGNNNNSNFKINYEVHIPASMNLHITNDYGNVFIDNLSGKLELNLDYGKFEIGELTHENNRIETDYLSNSSIDFIKGGIIHSDYSRLHILTAYKLKLNCDYSQIKINEIRRLEFDCDGGSLHVGDVKEVRGSGDYQNRYFAHINSLDFEGDYGSIQIEDPMPGFEKINLECDYTNVRIQNSNEVPYRISIQQEYGCFKQKGLEIYKEINDNGDKSIEGFYRNPHASSLIKITEDYGCIKIYN